MAFIFALLTLIPPKEAASIAAYLYGQPHLAPVLMRICHRESRCRPVRTHAIDSMWGRKAWTRAAYKGWLNPRCQPYRRGQWSTRGSFGLMAAYHVRFLPYCAPAAALDIPFISALAATQKLTEHCSKAPKYRISATNRWAFVSSCQERWRHRAKKLDYRLARSLISSVLSIWMPKDKKDDKKTKPPVVDPPVRTDDGMPMPPLRRMG